MTNYIPPTDAELKYILAHLDDPICQAQLKAYRAYMLTTDPLSQAASAMGKKGGSKTGGIKAAASRINGNAPVKPGSRRRGRPNKSIDKLTTVK